VRENSRIGCSMRTVYIKSGTDHNITKLVLSNRGELELPSDVMLYLSLDQGCSL